MSEDIRNIIIAVIVAVALCVSIFGISQCTQKTNAQYCQAINDCTKNGATWVNDSNSTGGHCIAK